MQADVPDMRTAAQMHRPGLGPHPATAQATQMIGVDLQTDAIEAFCIDAQVAGHRPQTFRQHYRGTAMQQAVGLMCTAVHHHAGAQRVIIEGLETDIQQLADGVALQLIEPDKVRLGTPDGHGAASLSL